MLGIDQGSTFTNVALSAILILSTVLVLYWAATIDNDIENNPDKEQ